MTLRPPLLVLALAVAASPTLAQTASQPRPYAGADAYRDQRALPDPAAVSYTHLRAHET